MAYKIKFGTTETKKFIEIYRRHECLWNTNHTLYKNREGRSRALKKFAKELNIVGFGPKEILAKIKNIRSQYAAEIKKIKSATYTGADADNVYQPKLYWFMLLDSFLQPTSETGETSSNLENQSQEQESEEHSRESLLVDSAEKEIQINKIYSEFHEETPIHRTTKRRSCSNINTEVATKRLHQTTQKACDNEDEIEKFGSYVAACLKKISAVYSIKAQEEIQSVLSNYRILNLTGNHGLMLSDTAVSSGPPQFPSASTSRRNHTPVSDSPNSCSSQESKVFSH